LRVRRPEYAYGKAGSGKIGPDATLQFEARAQRWR
jgi:FKBP-type peptidyl-prolyl cis-trans isomerase